jgi:hypothetical protein
MNDIVPIDAHESISEILQRLPEHLPSPSVSIQTMRDLLSDRSYGILLFVFAVPNMVPLPAPGLSAMTGLPLLLLSVQFLVYHDRPWLPKSIGQRSIETERLQHIAGRALPWLIRIERVTRPRYSWLVSAVADRIIAAICILLSLLIMLPVPFGNALPAVSICCFAIAMLQRDGLLALTGFLFTLVSLVVIVGVAGAITLAVQYVWALL